MALRVPTDYTVWVDEGQLLPGQQIDETQPTQVGDDQCFVLDQAELVICEAWPATVVTSTSYVEVMKPYFQTRDTCGEDSYEDAGTFDHLIIVECWTDGAATGNVRVTDSSGNSHNINFTSSTQAWRTVAAAHSGIKLGHNIDYLLLEAKRTSGARIYVSGIAVFALEGPP